MYYNIRTLTLAAAGILVGSAAHAAGDPSGIWFDHNGRGAVEIAPCASGNGMCGYVVHIKEAKNAKAPDPADIDPDETAAELRVEKWPPAMRTQWDQFHNAYRAHRKSREKATAATKPAA